MPDETDLNSVIRTLMARITALEEIQGLLLADFAMRAPQPIQTLREISNDMSLKFIGREGMSAADSESLDIAQQELDKVFSAARGRLE